MSNKSIENYKIILDHGVLEIFILNLELNAIKIVVLVMDPMKINALIALNNCCQIIIYLQEDVVIKIGSYSFYLINIFIKLNM